jgi:hypothetical protein
MKDQTEKQQEEFTPYGAEWEAEMMKLTKRQLIALIRNAKTAT